MKGEGSVEIDRPIEEVFHYTNEKIAEWSPTVIEDEILEGEGGVGTKFRCLTKDHRGQPLEFHGTITRYDVPTHSAVHMVAKSFDIDAEYIFEDLGDGRTRVTQRSEVFPKGFFLKAMFFCCGWMMKGANCKVLDAEFASLKKHLEEGTAEKA